MDEGKVQIKWIIPEDDGIDMKIVTDNTCGKCERGFKTQKGLQVHNNTKHEGMRHLCNVCEYKAGDKSSLRRHIMSV